VVGDQGTEAFWENIVRALPNGTMDILIDDGSHRDQHMIMSLEKSLPLLRPGGVYICEDIHGAGNGFFKYLTDRFVYNATQEPTPSRAATKARLAPFYWGAKTTLNAFNTGTRIVPNKDQAEIFALTLYPYMAVVEKMISNGMPGFE
jgi:hypothetical protein